MEDDGNFFMHFDDYAKCFSMTAITAQVPTFIYNFMVFDDVSTGSVIFNKEISETYYVTVETIFDRIFRSVDGCEEYKANELMYISVICGDE